MKSFVMGLSVTWLLCSYGNATVSAEEYEEKRMLVVFDEELNEQEMKETVLEAGGEMTEAYTEVDMASVDLTSVEAENLRKDPFVHLVEEDIILKLNNQWEDWGIASTRVPTAWDSGFTGKGIKVAVIDSGISPHSDLDIAGGISTVGYTSSYKDDQGHGTHVAGIIGARNNSFGVRGVAYETEIYAVKAFDRNGEAYLSDLIEGIDWSIANGMDIINLSSGTQTSTRSFLNVVNKAYDSGLLIVAAAGNDGAPNGLGDTVDFPARYASVIGVGAVNSFFERAPFSSTGPEVEVAAPGVEILSTYLDNQYAYMSGTSMATPYVTGQLALLKQAYPELTNEQLRLVLIEHTKDLGAAGRDPYFGYGFIQAASFLDPVDFQKANPQAAPEFQDVTSFYSPAVTYLVQNQITRGISTTEFGVSKNIKRADAAIWLAKELGLNKETAKASGFTDVPDRAIGAVNALKEAGIVGGKTTTRFGAYDTLTRGEVAIILQRAYKLSSDGSKYPFSDVSPKYSDAVGALVANYITDGISPTKYGVSNSITRGQLAVFMYRLSN
ncbi:S8 family serine peptidase [Paenisporosarcina sp. FSL H8-0542]|uniref:S8 family peptidase n=1 Tax=Paenisporosarcina sp. FSL H8-0542 TaxID=2921401 RepID=UPI003159AE41